MTDLVDNGGRLQGEKHWNFEASPKETGSPPKWRRMNNKDSELPLSFSRQSPRTPSRYEDAADKEEIKDFFNKKFFFQQQEKLWKLPDTEEMFKHDTWEDRELLDMKDELNNVKNKLNDLNLDDWHTHTRSMNKAGAVLWTLKNHIAPEFPTQAWCKFYEVCSTFDVVSVEAQESLNSVHLCEAPGAFIAALNHHLQLEYPSIKWSWISTTLNPYYEGNPLSIMINDDRFILHTLDRWKFGHDYTGNLMDLNNLKYMASEARHLGPILLVTADGSIDCQDDPGEQEGIVSQLMYCEVICALHLLSAGGNFVIKMFTLYEHRSICVIYLLVCTFKEVHVFKPVTSKEGNSEVYVVCLDYVGVDITKPWLRKLRTRYGENKPENAIFPLSSIPKDFLDQLRNCATKFKDYQVETIERNLYLFKSDNIERSLRRTRRLRHMVAAEYIRLCKLKPLIGIGQPIVDPEVLLNTKTPNMDPREGDGSFSERQAREILPPPEKIDLILRTVSKNKLDWQFEGIRWLKFQPDLVQFALQVGKSVKSVNTSKFCSGKLLKLRNELRILAKDHYTCERVVNGSCVENELSPEILTVIKDLYAEDLNNTTMLNYKETLWASLDTQNVTYQVKAFHDIMHEINEQWRGSRLILQGYPMLTQFSVGMVYILGHLFERVGFVRPQGQDFAVIFDSFRRWDVRVDQSLKKLVKLMDELEDTMPEKSVLAVTPLKELVYGHPEFYLCVTAVNNLCVQEQICDIISILKSDPDSPNTPTPSL